LFKPQTYLVTILLKNLKPMDNMTHGYGIWKINPYILNEAQGYSSKCHTHWEKCMNSFLTINYCNIQTTIFCHMTQWIGMEGR
jgi:hypothetical protein